jgi:glutamate synthase domain-containing protein 1
MAANRSVNDPAQHADFSSISHPLMAAIRNRHFAGGQASFISSGIQMLNAGFPPAQGLYHPRDEHDACGVGFVADIRGRRSHAVVRQALAMLRNLQHRGACGDEADTGDGAGILVQTPDRFLRRVSGLALPPAGQYASGLVFLPPDASTGSTLARLIEEVIAEEGQRFLGWRDVAADLRHAGPRARDAAPAFRQVFVERGAALGALGEPEASACFERKLYVIRKRVEHAVRALDLPDADRARFYICSLSSRTLVYKGMLTAGQIERVFPDLTDPDLQSALALVHQRFSTNTFPSWPLAHPYRVIAHNGEINTLRGNINWMRAREALCRCDALGDDLQKILPVIQEGGSDTATFDNVLEFLVMAGRSLPHALLMMIPEPWQHDDSMPPDLRAFYEYHASLMEPWDGPASMAFSDGVVIGAVLDRNGLRPSRYCVTTDGLIVMASEAGALDIPAERILVKERLHPGRIFLIDTAQGRIVDDREIKSELARQHPYADWLAAHLVQIEDLPEAPHGPPVAHETVLERQRAFGYTGEDLRVLLAPMAIRGEEPIGSMGTDTPLAVLSRKPRLLYDYFKQLFAQVTNPPLDAIREELVTSMASTIGPERNLLVAEPESCRQIGIRHPVIDNDQVAKLRHVNHPAFRTATMPILFEAAAGGRGLEAALDGLCRRSSQAVADGCTMLILSDRGASRDRAPVPSLLATAAVHHHLVREGARTRCGLIVESGDAREVHHVALLLGYGAGVVNPYLAFETLDDMIRQGLLERLDHATAVSRYIQALNKGILKVMSKMGISTLQSYCGAQIFEAVGLCREVVDRYFTSTASRIGGIGLDEIAREVQLRHERAFPGPPVRRPEPPGGRRVPVAP